MKKILILLILLILSIIMGALAEAVWVDISGIRTLEEKEVLKLYNYRIKPLDIDTARNETVLKFYFSDKSTVFERDIDENGKYESRDEFKAEVVNIEKIDGVDKVQLIVYEWYDAELDDFSYERHMQVDTEYEIRVNARNTGAADALFRIELLPSDGFLKIRRPSTFVRIDEKDSATAVFEVKADELERSGDIIINIYYENSLLDTYKLSGLDVTGDITGFIKDYKIQSRLKAGRPYSLYVTTSNEDEHPHEFKLEMVSSAFSFQTNPVIFTIDADSWNDREIIITPLRDGNQSIELRYYANSTLIDTETISLEVMKTMLPEISYVDAPETVQNRVQESFFVLVENPSDDIITATLVIRGLPDDVFIDEKEKTIQVNPDDTQLVEFSFVADTEKDISFDVVMLSDGEDVSRKAVSINVAPDEPGQQPSDDQETGGNSISEEEMKKMIEDTVRNNFVRKEFFYLLSSIIVILLIIIIALTRQISWNNH